MSTIHKQIFSIVIVIAVLAAGWYYFSNIRERSDSPKEELYRGLVVEQPASGGTVSFPLTVKGHVTGENYWTPFEAQAGTVQVFDGNGSPVSSILPLSASGEWMQFPSYFEVTFTQGELLNEITTENGYLLFRNDNASGEAFRDREYRLPVQFAK